MNTTITEENMIAQLLSQEKLDPSLKDNIEKSSKFYKQWIAEIMLNHWEVSQIKATYIHTDETGQQRLIEQNTSLKEIKNWNKENITIVKVEHIPLEDILDGKFEYGLITKNVEVG
jgi:hypothetical protein